MRKIRNGRTVKTIIHDAFQHCVFSEIDNLDTKSFDQAENNYEKTFVIVRKVLEENEQFCCDDEVDRLALAQVITDSLKQKFIIRKD
tara:strand:- start:420 stop:680 length:261 start_codon:yes stop_codon:yes gene_type:complete